MYYPEAQIIAILGIGRTQAAYLESGLEYALHDVARTGKPRHSTILDIEYLPDVAG